jgi:formylglycine-generating enzyme required for sulfatase activity
VEIGHAATASPSTTRRRGTRCWLQPYRIADRLVSCGDYAEFIADGGYRTPSLWLSDGWALVQAKAGRRPPTGWHPATRARPQHWQVFGLHGVRPLDPMRRWRS